MSLYEEKYTQGRESHVETQTRRGKMAMHTEAERLEGWRSEDQQGWRATGNQKRPGRILPYRFQRDTTAIGHPDFRLQTSELWDSTVLML